MGRPDDATRRQPALLLCLAAQHERPASGASGRQLVHDARLDFTDGDAQSQLSRASGSRWNMVARVRRRPLAAQAKDSTFQRGSVGFKTAFAQAEFDNVLVSPNPAVTLLADDFQDPTFHAQRWIEQPEQNWSNVEVGGGNRLFRQSIASGSARAISGVAYETAEPEMADHVVEARVRAINFGSTADPRFGLLARYRDSANFTFVTLHRNGRIVLGQLNGGTQKIFGSVAATIAAGTWYTLRLEAVDDRLRVYLNSAMRLDVRDAAVDPASTRGLYGLTTSATAAEFDDVRVTQP